MQESSNQALNLSPEQRHQVEVVGHATGDAPASFTKRLFAQIVDLSLALGLSLNVAPILGIFAPLDIPENWLSTHVISLAVGLIYLTVFPVFFRNSLGKWIFGLQIRSLKSTEQPVGLIKRLARTLALYLLLPLNFLLAVFGRRRHFGDRLTSSYVAQVAQTSVFEGCLVGLLLGGLMIFSSDWVRGYSLTHTESYRLASRTLVRQLRNPNIGILPVASRIDRKRAIYIFDVEGKRYAVGLKRQRKRTWSVLGYSPDRSQIIGNQIWYSEYLIKLPPIRFPQEEAIRRMISSILQ